MTVSKNIALMQGILRGYDSNLQFSNEFVYTALIDARAELISKKLDRFQNISRSTFQKFCMELVEGNSHECGDCIPEGITCKVYRSKYPVPQVIDGKIRDYLDVLQMNNKIVDYIREEDADIIQYDDYKKTKPFYSLVNNYLLLWNSTNTKAVQLRGLWYNPVDWIGKQLCTSSTTCYDVETMNLFMPASLRISIFQRAIDIMRLPLQLTEQDIEQVEKSLAV